MSIEDEDIIEEKYSELIKRNKKILCHRCIKWVGQCYHFLIPVTSDGKNCPYFEVKADKIDA